MHAASRMPVNRAKIPIAGTAITEPSTRPAGVIGYPSPWPTVVSVATAHHIEARSLCYGFPQLGSCGRSGDTIYWVEAAIALEGANSSACRWPI